MSHGMSVIDLDLTESPSQPAGSSWTNWSDTAGMVASIGCAIHCAAMPFVIAYLPALGLSFLADEAFHKWMALGCFLIALMAFVPGLRTHGRLTPVLIGSVGLVMISVAAFGFAGECCAACEANSVPAAQAELALAESDVTLVESDDSDLSTAEGAVCTEGCCPLCAAAESDSAVVSEISAPSSLVLSDNELPSEAAESEIMTSSIMSSSLIGSIVPWAHTARRVCAGHSSPAQSPIRLSLWLLQHRNSGDRDGRVVMTQVGRRAQPSTAVSFAQSQ